MVEVVDENPCAEWLASVKLGHGYDQSGVTMAMVPPLSPQPARPAHPPETVVTAVPPDSTLLVVPTAVTPPEAESHQ